MQLAFGKFCLQYFPLPARWRCGWSVRFVVGRPGILLYYKLPFQQLKKSLDFNLNVLKEIETALYIFSFRFKAYFNHD